MPGRDRRSRESDPPRRAEGRAGAKDLRESVLVFSLLSVALACIQMLGYWAPLAGLRDDAVSFAVLGGCATIFVTVAWTLDREVRRDRKSRTGAAIAVVGALVCLLLSRWAILSIALLPLLPLFLVGTEDGEPTPLGFGIELTVLATLAAVNFLVPSFLTAGLSMGAEPEFVRALLAGGSIAVTALISLADLQLRASSRVAALVAAVLSVLVFLRLDLTKIGFAVVPGVALFTLPTFARIAAGRVARRELRDSV